MPESGFPPSPPSQIPPADPTRDLGGALHEVSNALTVVIGWIDRARAEAGLDLQDPRTAAHEPALHRALEIASARASHARSIVRRAIEPEGTSAGTEPSAPVGAIVADALAGLEVELARAGVTPASHVDARVGEHLVDAAITVVQILTNLLLNAIAMSPRGARVTIEARSVPAVEGAASVVFVVADEGPGVPPERRASIFRGGVTTRAGGAGIGLRHAASLARVHSGALALGETPVGARGARFELTWPLAASHARSATPSAPPSSAFGRPPLRSSPHLESPSAILRAMPLAGTRILLVEDDDAVVDLLDTALTARGADVVSIRHRRDLAKALATGPFNVALFDISPIQDDVKGAVALTRNAVGLESSVRVVLISGSAARMPDMPDDWVAAWVRKPFEIAEILDALQAKH